MSAPDVVTTTADLRRRLDTVREAGASVGFVPTMGYLHEGHGSLVDVSVAANDLTVVSVFVNPLQFAPTDDLADYPRDFDADVARCGDHGSDLVFHPTVDEVYPEGEDEPVAPGAVAGPLEGASRPNHFAGTRISRGAGVLSPTPTGRALSSTPSRPLAGVVSSFPTPTLRSPHLQARSRVSRAALVPAPDIPMRGDLVSDSDCRSPSGYPLPSAANTACDSCFNERPQVAQRVSPPGEGGKRGPRGTRFSTSAAEIAVIGKRGPRPIDGTPEFS